MATATRRGKEYARGTHALAECQRSGQKMRYRDLVEDGHIKGLLVHPDWWEPKHPQEIPVEVTDPVALYRPAPEISIPAGYGDAENLDGGTTPTMPQGPPLTFVEVPMTAGDTHVVVEDAVIYIIGQWLYITLDNGSDFFVSRITTTTNSPTFSIPFTTPFAGLVTGSNKVRIEDT